MKADIFAGTVEVDGKPLRAGAIVLTDANGQRHYDLTNHVEEIAAGYPDDPDGASRSQPSGLEGAPSGDWNLLLLDGDFNADVAPPVDAGELCGALEAQLTERGISGKVALGVAVTLGGATGDYGAGDRALFPVPTDTAQATAFTHDHEFLHDLGD